MTEEQLTPYQQALVKKHPSCDSHCCKIHGCKYGYDDCPVVVTDMQGMTGRCEQCGLEDEDYFQRDEEMRQLTVEVERLQRHVADLMSGMWVNCVYCGARYGPADDTPVTMAEILTRHVARCPHHPMSKLKTAIEDAIQEIRDVRGSTLPAHDVDTALRTIQNRLGDTLAALEPKTEKETPNDGQVPG